MGRKPYRIDRDNLSPFAKRVKALRHIKSMTQEQAARALNVHRTSYTKYETDTAMPDAECLRDMAVFFDVSLDYLMNLSDKAGRDAVENGMEESELQMLSEFRRLNKKQQRQLLEYIVALRRGQVSSIKKEDSRV